jgi:hypothetical protein
VSRDRADWFCWSWLGAAAATGGTVLGIGVGGALGLGVAKLAGVPDYRGSLDYVLAGASLFGALGCFVAQSFVRDHRAALTAFFVLVMLVSAQWVADLLTGAIANLFSTTFGTAINIAVSLYVVIPLLSPLLARLMAAAVPWHNHQSAG